MISTQIDFLGMVDHISPLRGCYAQTFAHAREWPSFTSTHHTRDWVPP